MARHTTRLIKLLDRHGPERTRSRNRRRHRAWRLFRRRCRAPARTERAPTQRRPAIDLTLPDDSRVRSLRVTPHALGSYDGLAVHAPAPKPTQEDSDD